MGVEGCTSMRTAYDTLELLIFAMLMLLSRSIELLLFFGKKFSEEFSESNGFLSS